MKRLGLIMALLLLLVSCGGQKNPTQAQPLPTSEAVLDNLPETKSEPKPAPKPTEPKKLTYQDHKKQVLHTLANLTEFTSETNILVKATGGSFLLPRFDITVDKTLAHRDNPLDTHVIIETKGPIFLRLGPARYEMYTKPDGTVYELDAAKNMYVRQPGIDPKDVRPRFDSETVLQEKIWNDKKFELTDGTRLKATYDVKGKEARDLISEILQMYGMALEFDSQDMVEELRLVLEYDPKTYHPMTLQATGTTEAFGYDLAMTIDVRYDDVTSD